MPCNETCAGPSFDSKGAVIAMPVEYLSYGCSFMIVPNQEERAKL